MQSVKTERPRVSVEVRPSSKIDRLLRAGICVLAAALAFAIYAAIHQRVVVAGDSAPDFTVTADNGHSISAANFGGKLLVLNFWASWCGPCVEETPSLSRFAQQYADKGVVVLALSVDRDEKAYRGFLQRYKPEYLTARDSKIHADYGTFMYPETYFIDATGRVLRKYAEAVDFSSPEITGYVNSLL
jgi:cytochrome c biogenesis protein CcmG, thiol:disulfide interchange protein DsbE